MQTIDLKKNEVNSKEIAPYVLKRSNVNSLKYAINKIYIFPCIDVRVAIIAGRYDANNVIVIILNPV